MTIFFFVKFQTKILPNNWFMIVIQKQNKNYFWGAIGSNLVLLIVLFLSYPINAVWRVRGWYVSDLVSLVFMLVSCFFLFRILISKQLWKTKVKYLPLFFPTFITMTAWFLFSGFSSPTLTSYLSPSGRKELVIYEECFGFACSAYGYQRYFYFFDRKLGALDLGDPERILSSAIQVTWPNENEADWHALTRQGEKKGVFYLK